ncbi:uncharacterized protein PRCAT00000387001 [Priceomyces carsonii]|uniref:uncharacterized protein n=1 Tax=Priceomyces carsonii TaxID=28549 RepID=UPI002EDB88B8|nr:unnamed protein product [Priceomyces carsonii]
MSKTYTFSDLKMLTGATLRSWFDKGSISGKGRFAVVDVRDSDYVGGHLKGCYHYPAGDFESQLPELKQRLYNNHIDDVVFHCALSQSRGPSSALKFLRSLEDTIDPDEVQYFEDLNVWLLKGGFNKWQQVYGEDTKVTEGYDKELWQS